MKVEKVVMGMMAVVEERSGTRGVGCGEECEIKRGGSKEGESRKKKGERADVHSWLGLQLFPLIVTMPRQGGLAQLLDEGSSG